ncbi:hypothetical protein N2152v2_005472 [Parachlorella kessleri]
MPAWFEKFKTQVGLQEEEQGTQGLLVPYLHLAAYKVRRSMFLVGPFKQIKNMFDSKRVVSTAIYLVSIMFTLIAAWKFHSVILCMFFIVVQFAAYIWYCLSYVPFAQAMVMRFFGREVVEG